MGRVIIGLDPHKLSATIETLDDREKVLGGGRFGTDRDGYRQMLATARRWPDRVRAVEGCNGIGRHLAQRLVADGEQVVDVPAKLSARARVFSTGHSRKTDATDAHAIAVVAVRTPNLSSVAVEGELVALRLLADRRDELAGARTRPWVRAVVAGVGGLITWLTTFMDDDLVADAMVDFDGAVLAEQLTSVGASPSSELRLADGNDDLTLPIMATRVS